MLLNPIFLDRLLVSCAETRQTGAANTSAAIKTRFIMRKSGPPLQHHYKSGRSVTADRGWIRRLNDPIPATRRQAHHAEGCNFAWLAQEIPQSEHLTKEV